MVDTLTKAWEPTDTQYMANRRHILKELSTQSESALKAQLDYLEKQPAPVDDQHVAVNMFHRIKSMKLPRRIKSILDSTSGTTGSVLIRQDLEP